MDDQTRVQVLDAGSPESRAPSQLGLGSGIAGMETTVPLRCSPLSEGRQPGWMADGQPIPKTTMLGPGAASVKMRGHRLFFAERFRAIRSLSRPPAIIRTTVQTMGA